MLQFQNGIDGFVDLKGHAFKASREVQERTWALALGRHQITAKFAPSFAK